MLFLLAIHLFQMVYNTSVLLQYYQDSQLKWILQVELRK